MNSRTGNFQVWPYLIITYFKISDTNKDDNESLTMSGEDVKIEDFFCMSCFHKSYTKWKIQNGINWQSKYKIWIASKPTSISVSYYVLICHLRKAELSTLTFYSLVIIVQSENSFSNLEQKFDEWKCFTSQWAPSICS